MLRTTLLSGAAAVLTTCPAYAQTAPAPQSVMEAGTGSAITPNQPAKAKPPAATVRTSTPKDYHAEDSKEIVVTGFRRNREDLLSGTAILSGEALQREMRPTIGETLARQPGVSATSFGPNASRPVLRGFQGERVRVLTDGIGSLDVSNTSVDHAVAINPLTAQRIEVLRGPAALLFGSAAIGGVVNVIDARIPRRVPDEPVHVESVLTYGSAADERSANAAVDVPVGSTFVIHVDGNYTKSDDLEIGGFVLSRALREEAAASPDAAVRDLALLKGHLPNSAAETWDVAVGAAYVSGENNIGFSVNHYDSLYGVPIRYSLDPAVEAEAPRIDIHQNRADVRAEIDAGSGFLDTVRFRAGYSDYKHNELEEDGAIGTTFTNKGFEARLEGVQSIRSGWSGGFGAQYFSRKFDVEGDEKFLPRNDTAQIGIFALQSLDLGAVKLEAGARYEHSSVDADADIILGNPRLKRNFDAVSGSVGGSYQVAQGVRVGINASHTERAPSAEELFANGPHAGTQAFEIGDPNLKIETSWGLEATLHASGDGYRIQASVYRSWFDNYIYDTQTGAIQDDLPVFQNLQADARYTGFELEGSLRLGTIGKFTINGDGLADYTRASIIGSGPVPRIPPLRLLGGLEAQSDAIQARAEVEWVDSQRRVSVNETPTDGYTMVNASLSFQPFHGRGNRTSITISANNIFDVAARRHASFLKDFAPLPGRDIRISAHLNL